MHYRKVYGQSKIEKCPFCERTATTANSQGVPVCISHKNEVLSGFKCLCGETLDVMSGKWGPYFNCMSCGNMNFRKALEINPDWNSKKDCKKDYKENPKKQISAKPNYNKEPDYNKEYREREYNKSEPKKEITIRSDELDFYFG